MGWLCGGLLTGFWAASLRSPLFLPNNLQTKELPRPALPLLRNYLKCTFREVSSWIQDRRRAGGNAAEEQ